MWKHIVAVLVLVCIASLVLRAETQHRTPILKWSTSLRGFGYAVPTMPVKTGLFEWPHNFVGNDVALILTDHLAIVAFTVPLTLQTRAETLDGRERTLDKSEIRESRAIRLVAFDLANGQNVWQRVVQACESRPDPFLWTVKGEGYAVRTPWSIEIYSETGELIHKTPLPGVPLANPADANAGFPGEMRHLQGVSPSGKTALVVLPEHADPTNPAPQILIALDILTGKRLATIRAPLESAITGDQAMAFAVHSPTDSESCCVGPYGVVKNWDGEEKMLYHRALAVVAFISDSRFLAVANTGDPRRGTQWSLLLMDTKGSVIKRQDLQYEHQAAWYVSFGSATEELFALSLASDDGIVPSRQEIVIYDSHTLSEVSNLRMDGPQVVRAKAALTADGKVAILNGDTLMLYDLSAHNK